jgi:hypothetical protein
MGYINPIMTTGGKDRATIDNLPAANGFVYLGLRLRKYDF